MAFVAIWQHERRRFLLPKRNGMARLHEIIFRMRTPLRKFS